MQSYFNCHNHTALGSNIRLLDSINKPEDLIRKAAEMGLTGLAITDHESLSAHIVAEKYFNTIKAQYPDFRLGLGNEIYLTDTRDKGQKYYHFILIAKDEIGHRCLRELSSLAWLNSYTDRKMERVPILKTELAEIIKKFSGHLIATTACIGGELSQLTLLYKACRKIGDTNNAMVYYKQIKEFLEYCVDLFKDDFYIECAPALSQDQISVNQILRKIAENYNIKMTVGTDSHYLSKEDRTVHKAYLNSKDGDREVDIFYEYTYLMSPEEVLQILSQTFNDDIEFTKEVMNNSIELGQKIQPFSLFHKQDIPIVDVKDYPKSAWWGTNNDYADEMKQFPTLCQLFTSEDTQDRYWVNECWNELNQKNKGWNYYNETGDNTYLLRLEEEARVKNLIGEKLETNMFRYPNTLQHYIDMIWDCGSMVGAGRGSSCAALNHELMGVTQLDPIKWELPFFRYLNDERIELGSLLLILPSCKKRL